MKIELKDQTIVRNEINSDHSVKVEDEAVISALMLICQRYFERINFTENSFFQLELLHTKAFIEFKSQSKLEFDNEKQIKPIIKTIQRLGKVEVFEIETKNCREEPPLLFNSTDLQNEANIKYNICSEETLRIAQKLYKNQFITDPQTKSTSISNKLWTDIPKLILSLNERETYKKFTNGLRKGGLNKRIVKDQKVKDQKVKDQHGILITNKIPSALSVKERIIYEMIMYRFLEAVSQASIKEVVTVILEISHYQFKAEYCRIIDAGWRSTQGSFSPDLIILPELPSLKIGDELKIKQFSVNEKKTKPPKPFTEISLSLAMKAIGNDKQNEKLLEELLVNNYVILKNRSLIPTEKGLKLFEKIHNKSQINLSEKVNLNQLILNPILSSELICPKCKQVQLTINEKIIQCTELSCNWKQFRHICGVQLSIKDIEKLINNGITSLIEGFQVKSGKKFNAFIQLNKKAESLFIIEKK